MTNAQKLLMIGGAPWLTRRDYPKLVGGLEAWFDETDPSSMIMDSANRVSLIADKSGNSSTNVLCLNGVAGNYASAPDSVPLSITGDILIEADLTPVSWANGANQMVASKCHNSGQYAYQLFLLPAGGLRLSGSANGTTFTLDASSSAAVSFSALQRGYIRATRQLSSGDVKFYTSTDGVNWVQLGTTQATTAATSYFDGTDILEIGTNVGGTSNRYNGLIHRVRIYNTYDSAVTPAFDANFATFSKLAATGTESSSNAATVTINTSGATGARISGARDRYQGTAANQPVLLRHTGENYATKCGTSNDTISTPDTSAWDSVTELRLVMKVSANWDSLNQRLFGKWLSTGNRRSWVLGTNTSTTKRPSLYISGDGSVTQGVMANADLTGSQLTEPLWLMATWRASDQRVQFFTAPNQSTVPSSWTQLGTDVTMPGSIATLFKTSEIIRVSDSETSVSAEFTGNIYWASAGPSLSADPIVVFDPARYVSGTTFTAATGEVWTISAGAMIVTRSGLYGDGVDDYSKTPAFNLPQPATVSITGSQLTWTTDDRLYDGNALNSCGLLQKGAGGAAGTSPSITQYAGAYGANEPAAFPAQTGCVIIGVFDGASSILQVARGVSNTGSAGTTAANGFTSGAGGDGSNSSNTFTSEELLFSKNLSSSQRARLALWSARKHRLPAV